MTPAVSRKSCWCHHLSTTSAPPGGRCVSTFITAAYTFGGGVVRHKTSNIRIVKAFDGTGDNDGLPKSRASRVGSRIDYSCCGRTIPMTLLMQVARLKIDMFTLGWMTKPLLCLLSSTFWLVQTTCRLQLQQSMESTGTRMMSPLKAISRGLWSNVQRTWASSFSS
jgi:hypothetical protein